MPKKDFAQLALSIVRKATESFQPNIKKGQAGGRKGGKARAKSLTKQKRVEIARVAAAARWKKSN